MDFQSIALPTELSGQQLADQTGIEPAVSSVTGRHVNRYTTDPFDMLIYYRGNKGKKQDEKACDTIKKSLT